MPLAVLGCYNQTPLSILRGPSLPAVLAVVAGQWWPLSAGALPIPTCLKQARLLLCVCGRAGFWAAFSPFVLQRSARGACHVDDKRENKPRRLAVSENTAHIYRDIINPSSSKTDAKK